jgi:hypothetical protein
MRGVIDFPYWDCDYPAKFRIHNDLGPAICVVIPSHRNICPISGDLALYDIHIRIWPVQYCVSRIQWSSCDGLCSC